jgi:hypothetical protein
VSTRVGVHRVGARTEHRYTSLSKTVHMAEVWNAPLRSVSMARQAIVKAAGVNKELCERAGT